MIKVGAKCIGKKSYSSCADCYEHVAYGCHPHEIVTCGTPDAMGNYKTSVVSDEDCDVYGAPHGTLKQDLSACEGWAAEALGFSQNACETCGDTEPGEKYAVEGLILQGG
jgi:hypothetical protein